MTKVKICGLTRQQDAELALEFGADAVGFIHEPKSPRFVGEGEYKWIERLAPFAPKIAVFGRVDRPVPQGVFDLVQGVEWEIFPVPYPKRIHVLRLRNGQKADDLINQTVNASALMLDAYKEEAYGGTGHQVDWNLAAEIVQRAERRVILAGGLTPENVAEAIRRVRPYAVDVASGVESAPGVKDAAKLRDFIQAAKQA
ncbi:phosphoribosylanthranilate isomerase [Fimbriimonas ginsengisoli]|uniref:N-(5'-phosphoribosyl)anthranilate isomerase n=1 Tax=Fimbriimonas ginsengisoli Gsoil 348 TaxID=661478 RepID=A0A068NXK9_FIMGI|nr:phosphoribosylanthranilate isomerase [Fimbriimonas ginsengisoli]AIE88042.1 N-(5'-phosphoribosyl)anthranilate isomerase [Fimbriimonas ginsengisoli Gsoil 348]